MNTPSNIIIVIGLILGGALGMAGTMATDPNVRASLWAVDSVGLIVATVLLAVKYFRAGNDIVSAGFLIFAIGEAVILSGTAATLEASVPSFAAGTALWSAGLMLTCVPRHFAMAVRTPGVIAAILFAISSATAFQGEKVLPTSTPLPFYAYPFLVLTFAGWIWTVVKKG